MIEAAGAREEIVGAGCEGVVSVRTTHKAESVRVKRYHRRSELERGVVGAALIEAGLIELGWADLVSVPVVLGVDLLDLVVVTAPFVRAPTDPLPARLVDARVRARAAIVCAAGVAAGYSTPTVRKIVETRCGPDVAAALTRCWFEGVALKPDSLLCDGERWVLVDL
ncbi:hypothetical protein GCM10009557_20730 [Virgisporangium ochraceum]|uniref:Uncharacterized protein n=1 Tax=Virgisporangium ochraceum TaxID=65505 RepID=A0A8J4EE44_9ACTN|nr:hypothetical protein Voc01_062530 [Virgisporangium ochraceum]